uniref:Astacin domain-containing protein n=1 Tax=Strongyloides venezuelensis TaxID=75913 RepID=A0A0K0EVV6_STRVS
LRFNETLNFSNGVLRYANASNGCFSSRGKIRDDTWQGIVVGRVCSYFMGVLHEILRALSVIHEIAHDRDSYIDVRYGNIKSDSHHNFDHYDLHITSPHGLNYDFGSIMHYSRYLGTKNNQETMVPKTKYCSYLRTMRQTTRFGFNNARQLNPEYCSDKYSGSRLNFKMNGYLDHKKNVAFVNACHFLQERKKKDKYLTVSGNNKCYYKIIASNSRKIRLAVSIDLPDSKVCQPNEGLETKFLVDKSVSSAVLCGKICGEIITSEINVFYVKYAVITPNSAVKIKYGEIKY